MVVYNIERYCYAVFRLNKVEISLNCYVVVPGPFSFYEPILSTYCKIDVINEPIKTDVFLPNLAHCL